MLTPARYDLLGLGCAAVDELLQVAAYPRPGEKCAVESRARRAGGTTATALAAAARFGAAAAYAGVLGNAADSTWLLDQLSSAGVDVSCAQRRDDGGPIRSTVVLESCPAGERGRGARAARPAERTVLYDLSRALACEAVAAPEEVIRQCRVLLVDPLGVPRMIEASKTARASGLAVVADFESDAHPRFGELLSQVDHLVLSQDFAARLSGEDDPAGACRALANDQPRTVVVTCGGEGCWWIEPAPDGPGKEPAPRHFPAARVEAVDTTGCGDLFHGVYAATLAWGWPIERRLAHATAAAALWASRDGGWEKLPTREETNRLVDSHPWTNAAQGGR